MRRIFLAAALALVAAAAGAQQITRFGVVDTAKVYQAYFKASAPMRTYESKKADFQKEIDKRTDEIRRLRQEKSEAQSSGDEAKASRIDADIAKRTESLSEYTRSKNIELEELRSSLRNSDDFYNRLYSVIGRVAENEGFTMILSLQQGNGILWYSSSVDVTNKVIRELGL